MARNVGSSIENAFTRGLVTEVTGVNSPENSVTETLNVQYGRTGKASKRLGINYELDYELNNVSIPGVRLEYVWQAVSDNLERSFVVTQVGSRIYFYESSSEGSLSSQRKPFFIDLLAHKVPVFSNAQVSDNFCSFSSGKGYLFIAHPHCEILYIKYNPQTDSISSDVILLAIRDLEGVPDGLGIDIRPNTISNAHYYNLLNQGWYANARVAGSPGAQNVYNKWVEIRNDYPSNADVWWYFTEVLPSSGVEVFQPTTADSRAGLYGNTPAPKGHYILSAFQTQRSLISGRAVQESSSDGLRPSVVCFYAGRAFYAGVGKSGFSSTIYFSQIIESDNQLGMCYQRNDPTSREISDLLDTDGGTIKIQDINNIYDLRVVGQSLIVFASNGIWSISGTDNGSFKATDYSVTKISSFPSLSKTSIVDISGTPVWWNYEGIFSLKSSDLGLTNEVTSLSVPTIQSFYDDIPSVCKVYAKGVSNDQARMVYWIYSSDQLNPTGYDRVLVLDSVTSAFYVYSLPNTPTQIVGVVSVRSVEPKFIFDQIITSTNDLIVTNANDSLIIRIQDGYVIGDKVFKFLTDDGINMSFAEIRDTSYLDWGDQDYITEFITGYRIRGELLKKSQTNYLVVITEDQENSSCLVQPLWDYSNDWNSGRFGTFQEIYRTRLSRDYQRSKLKMRGTGYSLQFKFVGQMGKPFTIVGWAGFESVNGTV